MNSLKLVCCQERQAVKMCMIQKCQHHSLLCNNQDCSCNQKHLNCMGSTLIAPVVSNISKKQRSYDPINSLILQFYDSMIKYLIRQKEEYQTKNTNQSMLNRQEKKLMEYIEKGKSKDIMPSLVFKTVKSLTDEPILNIDQKFKKLEEQLKRAGKIIMEELTKVKEFFGKAEKKGLQKRFSAESRQVQCVENLIRKDFSFDSKLCHNNFLITNNSRQIRSTKLGQYYTLGLASPAIQYNTRIFINIISSLNDFSLGICDEKQAVNNNFERRDKTKLHMISSQGEIVNSSFSEENKSRVNFQFYKKDLIEIVCNLKSSELKFINKQRRQEVTLRFQKDKDSRLHFCVCMFGVGSEVQIVPQIAR